MIDLVINALEVSEDSPKCLETLGNLPLLSHLLEAVKHTSSVRHIYIVLQTAWKDKIEHEMRRWNHNYEKPLLFITLPHNVFFPIFLHGIMETNILYMDITFPFLSYQIFEWFCKAKENRKVTVLVGNFKQKHFVSTDVLYKAPCKKNTLLLHSNESNNLRAMNFFHVPFECRSILETSQRVDSVAHILSAEGTHVCVLPQYFMAYEGLIYRSLLDKEYCEYMYRIQNRTNSTMEFYYLWKQLEKLESRLEELESQVK